MFSTVHLIWLAISIVIIIISLKTIKSRTVTLDKLLTVACIVCIVSEVIKVFSSMQLVPSADGTTMYPYHSMLIILGAGIIVTKEVKLRKKHYFSTIGILGILAFISVYLNSMLAAPTYISGKLMHVDYTPNFFFTVKLPFDIVYTEIWQWYLYVGCIVFAAVIIIALFYIPFFRRK